MDANRPVLNQLNIVSGNLRASIDFYRRLGITIPEQRVWSTSSGAHHANAECPAESDAVDLDFDSANFAQVWNTGWRGRPDLKGRVVIGFGVATRESVDRLYGELTVAGYRGLQAPYDAFWGARYAIVEDPDGIAVGLMSPVADQHRSATPQV